MRSRSIEPRLFVSQWQRVPGMFDRASTASRIFQWQFGTLASSKFVSGKEQQVLRFTQDDNLNVF